MKEVSPREIIRPRSDENLRTYYYFFGARYHKVTISWHKKLSDAQQLSRVIHPLETIHLFQRLSIAIRQANAVSFTSTFKSEWEPYPKVIV